MAGAAGGEPARCPDPGLATTLRPLSVLVGTDVPDRILNNVNEKYHLTVTQALASPVGAVEPL